MKVTVIGSHLCPDTLYALNKLCEAKADIEFKNLSASLPDLKAYLALRESSPLYESVRKNGGIGIPGLCPGGRHRHPGSGGRAEVSQTEKAPQRETRMVSRRGVLSAPQSAVSCPPPAAAGRPGYPAWCPAG